MVSALSHISDEDVDIKIKSCGKTKGIELIETEGGFISENFALAAASFDINLNFVARVDCDSGNETVLLAEFAPGIKIYQLGTKVCYAYLSLSKSKQKSGPDFAVLHKTSLHY